MRSHDLRITFETRREMGVLMIAEPGSSDLYEVIGRARQVDRYGAEDSTLVLVKRLASEHLACMPETIIATDYDYAIGIEIETESGRKFQASWTPKQSISNCYGLPVAVGEFLLESAVTGKAKQVVLREDLSRLVADAAGLTGRSLVTNS